MPLRTLTFQIQGVAPLLLHNGQTADPLNSFSKEIKKITGKSKKTDADHEEIARLEWQAGLYVLDGNVVIPGEVLQAMFENAAKKIKKGPAAKAGLSVIGLFPLEHNGPSDLRLLFENPKFRLTCKARVGKSSVMRTRPKFDKWCLRFQIEFNDSMLSEDVIKDILTIAGREIGLCDWRPRYGRFEIIT